jgi:predicted secreted protein
VFVLTAISEYVITQFAETLSSSDDITLGSLLSAIATLAFFTTYWAIVLVIVFLLSLNKQQAEASADSGIIQSAKSSTATNAQLILDYVDHAFHPVFLEEKWSWQSMANEVKAYHAWYQVLCVTLISPLPYSWYIFYI